jgi:hypothetical protein
MDHVFISQVPKQCILSPLYTTALQCFPQEPHYVCPGGIRTRVFCSVSLTSLAGEFNFHMYYMIWGTQMSGASPCFLSFRLPYIFRFPCLCIARPCQN